MNSVQANGSRPRLRRARRCLPGESREKSDDEKPTAAAGFLAQNNTATLSSSLISFPQDQGANEVSYKSNFPLRSLYFRIRLVNQGLSLSTESLAESLNLGIAHSKCVNLIHNKVKSRAAKTWDRSGLRQKPHMVCEDTGRDGGMPRLGRESAVTPD